MKARADAAPPCKSAACASERRARRLAPPPEAAGAARVWAVRPPLPPSLAHAALAVPPTHPPPARAQGGQLEPRMGSGRFALLVAELCLLSSGGYVALAAGLAALPARRYRAAHAVGAGAMRGCAVGFSGVLFALKASSELLSGAWGGWSAGLVRAQTAALRAS